MLNNRELRAINVYCQRFRVKNKSSFLREIIMTAILKRFDEEMPSLWEEGEPNLFDNDRQEVNQISLNESEDTSY